MPPDPMALGLNVLSRVAASPTAERFGLREPIENVVHGGTRIGFAAIQRAARSFKPLRKLTSPERSEPRAGAPLFDLTPDDEQELFRETVRRFAADRLTPNARAADDAAACPDQVRAGFEELGLALAVLPEALGGACEQRSAVTGTLILEELGRGDVGMAVTLAGSMSVAQLIVDCGTAEQQARYAAPFAEEDAPRAAIAVNEGRMLFDPFVLKTRARPKPDGFVLYGEKSLVAAGADCDFYVVAAELLGVGPSLFIVESGTEGVEVMPQPAIGLRAAQTAAVRFDGVQLPSEALLGGEIGAVDYADFVARMRIANAALATGCALAVVEYVVDYCNERYAFGEPISHRQAVAFLAADMAIESEGLQLVNWRAASRADAGRSFDKQAWMAATLAAEKGMYVGTSGVQLLGGHGFVKEHPVELWYRNLRALGAAPAGLYV